MGKRLVILTRKTGARHSLLRRGQSLAVLLKSGDSIHGSSMTLFYKGVKCARCTGGGFDMTSTVIADFLEDYNPKVSQQILAGAFKSGAYGVWKDKKGLFHFDGGCGEGALSKAFGVSVAHYGSV